MATKKDFVLDTNVILHDPNCHLSFKEHGVTIPIEVITELDNFKKGSETINYNAREFIRELDKFDKKELFNGGASLGEGLGKIRVDIGYTYQKAVRKNFPDNLMDHKILNTVYFLANAKNKELGKEIILVSKDVNLRMKASSLNLAAEDYKTDVVADVKSLYENIKTIEASDEFIDLVYNKKHLEFGHDGEFLENTFIIFKSNNPNSKNSALVIYRNEKIHLIKKDKEFNTLGIKPINAEQTFGMSVLLDDDIKLVTILGKAGTGKTIIALAVGLSLLGKQDKKVDHVLFTRETVSMGRDLGFLPGDVGDKLDPYMQGMRDNLFEIKKIEGNAPKIDGFERDKKIIIEPLPYIRSRSLVDKFFIVDEAQNLTPHEVKTIITRAGHNTKIILIGDISQIDVPTLDERSNGLSYVIDRFKGKHLYAHVVLIKGERSELSEMASDLL